jgi:hypothetical protein
VWIIWTDRKGETCRRGLDDETFERTIDHLRARGDRHVKIQRTSSADIVAVDLGTRKNPNRVA